MTIPKWIFYLVLWPFAVVGFLFTLDTYGLANVYANVSSIWSW
jgi:hypothetical protein